LTNSNTLKNKLSNSSFNDKVNKTSINYSSDLFNFCFIIFSHFLMQFKSLLVKLGHSVNIKNESEKMAKRFCDNFFLLRVWLLFFFFEIIAINWWFIRTNLYNNLYHIAIIIYIVIICQNVYVLEASWLFKCLLQKLWFIINCPFYNTVRILRSFLF
jgi:hypothetical protein